MLVIHVSFILIIAALTHLSYSVYRKNLAERNYENTRRVFPSFMIWPNNKEDYVLFSKIAIPIMLFFMIGFYLYIVFVAR